MKHEFSVFAGNIEDSIVRGKTDLKGLIMDIMNPDEITLCIIDEIRECTDDKEKHRLKAQLKGYTPAVLLKDRRRLVNIVSFSGLMSLDFDKLPDKQYAIELKQFIFNEYPFIYCSWLSASGKGVRAIVNIDQPKDKADYQAMFASVKHDCMADYEFINYFDNAPKNVVLPLYQSYDPDILVRDVAEVYTKRYIETAPIPVSYPPLEKPDSDDHFHVQNITRSAIDKITDNGHPQLRGASFALGGYVGAGYISEYDAINLIYRLIETNDYLSKKHEVYKKTAVEMIRQGTRKPLYL